MSLKADSEISVYDRLVWPEGVLETLLATGERRRELIAYFGPAEHAALTVLARAAAAVRPDPARVTWIVPGIMGSQLAIPRAGRAPPNLLWVDPVDFQHGGLLRLALDDGRGQGGPAAEVQPCGPVVHNTLRLKLALALRGHTVRVFDYDWRLGVRELGRRFAARLEDCSAGACDVVGHSMGGLVARAALLESPTRLRRIVTLGTPHDGAYAPLQALRGVYGTVRRLAQLDPAHTAEALATRVFAGFPSLYDMLPRGAVPDWLDPAQWPRGGPQPRATELARSRALTLPPAPEQLYCIVGSAQPTVTAARVVAGELRYRITLAGDGTVPCDSAALAGHPCRYVALPHSELPRDAEVAAAVAELLDQGRTARLAAAAPVPDTPVAELAETELRADFTDKLDWQHLTPEQRQAWLEGLNAPLRLPVPST